MFSIECEILSLKLVIGLLPNTSTKEEQLLHLHSLDETRREASLNVESHKKIVKFRYVKASNPRVFSQGDLVFIYDHDNAKIGKGKFVCKWFGSLVVKKMLKYEYMSWSIMMENPCQKSEMVSI